MIKRDSKGRFIKGSSNAWNKGIKYKCPKISIILKKLYKDNKRKGWNKGKKLDKKKYPNVGFQKGSKIRLGKKHNLKTRKKMSESGKKRIKEGNGSPPFKKGKENIIYNLSKEERKQKRAKQNPTFMSSIEIKIQNLLKQLGIEFFTHQYMKEIEHGYQCDILIPSMNLVIECDGNYWHKYPIGNDIDHIRTKELIKKGFKVLRLWEIEIKSMDINQFKNKLYN